MVLAGKDRFRGSHHAMTRCIEILELNMDEMIKAADSLSKLGCKIVDAVTSGVGGAVRPWQIRRVARAEGDAKITLTKADAESMDIRQRAEIRLQENEIRKQRNLESIIAKSLEIEQPNVSGDPVDPDWIAAFLEDAAGTSNDQIQDVWARLLAGEVSAPGKYSRRTLSCVKLLSSTDANLFAQACQLSLGTIGSPELFIPDTGDPEVVSRGVTFSSLEHLDSIGLIDFSHVGYVLRVESAANHIRIPDAFGTMLVGIKPGKNEIPRGKAILTNVGKELATLVDRDFDENYIHYLVANFAKKKISATYHCRDGHIIASEIENT